MAFSDDPLWEDSLTYSGLEIRRQDAMMLAADGTAGGAVPGIRPGDIGLAVSVAGSTITVTAGVAACFRAGFGVYRVSNPSSWTGTLAAANATNPRIDLVYVRVWDNAVDSSGLFKADVVYLQGTAAPSPVAPSPGATEIYIPLATINVPQSGGGSPSVSTTVRAITVAPGGISPNASQAGTYAGQYRDGATLQRYNGTSWEDKVYLALGGQVNIGSSGSPAGLAAVLSATSGLMSSARVSGDTQNRFQVAGDGKHQWGPGGSTVPDTDLYRSGVGALTTDGTFNASNVTTTQTYTPTISGGALTLGNGTITGTYVTSGSCTDINIKITCGSTTTLASSGSLALSVPSGLTHNGSDATGAATFNLTNGGAYHSAVPYIAKAATTMTVFVLGASTNTYMQFNTSNSAAVASGSFISVSIRIQA